MSEVTGLGVAVAAVIEAWRPAKLAEAGAGFARGVVAAAHPAGPARARSLLWACSRLGAWGASVGLEQTPVVLLHPSVIERFVIVAMAERSATARRTVRTNLRFVARRVGVALDPGPVALPRSRAKAPYSPGETAELFALARAQPTEARRQRLVGLLCLGLGAGIEGADLRAITGADVTRRGGGVVVAVSGRRARRVPVLSRYHEPLLASAAFAGAGFVCGGVSPARKNVTANLVGALCGGADVARLDTGRLRSTWLCEQLGRLGVPALLAAAGLCCSQRLGDLACHLPTPDEAALMAVLGR